MDVCRLNFSHGTIEEHGKLIHLVREASKKSGKTIAILQDLQGPKIRVGALPSPIAVVKNEKIILTMVDKLRALKKGLKQIPVQYKKLATDVSRGDRILIDDGGIELKVIATTKTTITCRVINSGTIKSKKGINVPTASISAPPLTKKDLRDLAVGIKHDVDFVALSFVREANDIHKLRALLKKRGSKAHIIAKIERHEAIKNLEAIIEASDAVMVARGDLGIEVKPETVPVLQKKIIRLANMLGKPVIVATQMLQSMIEQPRATRAEISDAATAIFDHADAFMLSNETCVGKYPVSAVSTLRAVASSVESALEHENKVLYFKEPPHAVTDITCANACAIAHDMKAKYIVAVTKTGYTAREIAKHRSIIPIIAFTPHEKVKQHLALVWGVIKTFSCKKNPATMVAFVKKTLMKEKLVRRGDKIVLCTAGQNAEQLTTTVRF